MREPRQPDPDIPIALSSSPLDRPSNKRLDLFKRRSQTHVLALLLSHPVDNGLQAIEARSSGAA